MAHQPTIRPDPASLPGSAPTSAWEELLTALRSAGDADASIDIAVDLILHEVVVQAQPATGGTGAAIALSRDGEMVCRASTGDNAPDLGARLSVNSGLSAECVRTRQMQRCDDSEFDPRVDAQLCRELGVRSFVVTPLISQGRVVGVFEVLSQHSWTFDDRAVAALEGLGKWAVSALEEAARTRERATPANPVSMIENFDVPLEDVRPLREEAITDLDSAATELEEIPGGRQVPSAQQSKDMHVSRPRRDLVTTLMGIAIVIVSLILGWVLGMSSWQKAWMKYQQGALLSKASPAAAKKVSSEQKAQTVVAPAQGNPAQTVAPAPKPETRAQRAAGSQPEGLVVYESGKVVFRETPRKLPVQAADRQRLTSSQAQVFPQPKTGPAVGSVGFAGAASPNSNPSAAAENTASLSAGPSPPPISTTSPRVSQISGGHLLQRVPPVYPARAKELHLQGKVMLEVLVARDGKVREIKLLSGDAILAQAAMAAVRQWEYEPYMLNGVPVEMPTRITVNFTYP
jgi:TonB family protein